MSSSDKLVVSDMDRKFNTDGVNYWRPVTYANSEDISSGQISVPDTHVSYEQVSVH